jgi:hypothetical protein
VCACVNLWKGGSLQATLQHAAPSMIFCRPWLHTSPPIPRLQRYIHSLPLPALLLCATVDHPSKRMRTVGLVGSYGKTTTAWLVRGMLEQTGGVVGMIGGWVGGWVASIVGMR